MSVIIITIIFMFLTIISMANVARKTPVQSISISADKNENNEHSDVDTSVSIADNAAKPAPRATLILARAIVLAIPLVAQVITLAVLDAWTRMSMSVVSVCILSALLTLPAIIVFTLVLVTTLRPSGNLVDGSRFLSVLTALHLLFLYAAIDTQAMRTQFIALSYAIPGWVPVTLTIIAGLFMMVSASSAWWGIDDDAGND